MATGAKRVTLRDVAQEVDLSVAAVSYALRGLQVPPETQQRVREAADRLGYRADPIARALVSGRTGQVGVICRSLTDPWQQEVAAALGRQLLASDRLALIVDSSNDPVLEERLAGQLLAQRVDAMIVLPTDPSAAHWAAVAEQTVLVTVGDGLPGVAAAAEIVFDNRTAVLSALRRLADAGHRRVAVLTPGEPSTPDRPVEVIAHEVAGQLGLGLTLHTSPQDLRGSRAVAEQLLAAADPPTAFFCLSDSMAYGVYAAARALGRDVPGDVSVLGSDDNELSALLTPPLSGYRWPFDELIAAVVAATVAGVVGSASTPRRVLHASPTEGGSIGPPKA
ncbi:MAG: LacI family DNA-binding transcriptional regulator [Nostocoides sp.]